MRTLRLALAATLSGLLLLAAGCDPIDEGGGAGPAPQDQSAGQGKDVALQQLDALAVGGWASMAGYTREKFPHWSSQGEGCDTRDAVLKKQGENVLTDDRCKIIQGSWYSVYDGKTTADPQQIDIDHMVPLANAWRTGASTWTDSKRGQFANDLVNPQLLAVTASTNRSKGDQDPSEWTPPRREYWCVYAQKWVAVKSYWKLSVRASEKSALENMLGTC